VVIVLENKPYKQIVGSDRAPYLNALIGQGKLFTHYTAVVSGSPHNYRAMTSGLTTGGSTGPNVFTALESSGRDWQELDESMTGSCAGGNAGKVPGTTVPLFEPGHDPASMYKSTDACKKDDLPMTSNTFIPSALADFTFIVPSQCDDMHTLPKGGKPCPAYFGSNSGTSEIKMGDDWLSIVVPQILAHPDETVLITWDESADSSEHIVTLEVGAGVEADSSDATAYDHYGLEAGLYRLFGLGKPPHNGATARPLPIP
jgi:phosphatidylinositol-3-phosphatase